MSDNQRPVAYAGNDPYIFVSYCHADSERVFPFILALQERYNVWFDDGIHFGEEWEEEIAQHIDNCAGFLFMVSARSLDSENCKDELHHARDLKKNFINIMMDSEFELPGWFRLRYSRYQICKLFSFSSNVDAVAALTEKSTWLNDIAKPEVKPEPKVAPPPEKPAETKPKAPPFVQQIRETPEETIKRLKGKLKFEKLPDGTYKLVKGSSELQTVEIPNFVSVIGDNAFIGAKLERIDIPDSVTMIGSRAFSWCENLSGVTLGRGLTRISDYMFSECDNLQSIRIPEGVTEIGIGAFGASGLTEITLPTTLEEVEKLAFFHKGLLRVNYCGTREQWEKIKIGICNDSLLNASITYNYTAP